MKKTLSLANQVIASTEGAKQSSRIGLETIRLLRATALAMTRFSYSASLVLVLLVSCAHTPEEREPQAIGGTTPTEAQSERRITELRNQGHHFYRRGDYLRAIPFLEAAEQSGEAALDAKDKFVLGYAHLAVGQGAKAEEVIRSGIKLSPYQPVGYQLLGLAALSQGKASQATEYFKRGLEFDSHPPKLHFYLGMVLGKLGNTKERDKEFQKAEEEYEKILLQNVYDFGSNFELAYIYLTLGHKIPKVGELIENARLGLKEADPEIVEGGTLYTQFYLPVLQGIEAYRKNDYSKASAILEQAALASPIGARADLAEIYLYLAASEKEAGRPETAASFAQMGKTLDPFGVSFAPKF